MNKKENILIASMELLEEEGDISTLNLRKTAKRAGCAHTNVYNYFTNFEALKWTMLEQALQLLDHYICSDNDDPEDAMNLISRYIDFALEHPALYKLIWTTDLDPLAAPADTGFLEILPKKIKNSIPEDKADILHSYVHGKLLNLIFSRIPKNDTTDQKAIILKVCLKLLRSWQN